MRSKYIGQALETNIAMPITVRKSHVIGTAVERDVAMPITPVLGSLVASLNALLAGLQRVGVSVRTALHHSEHHDSHDRDPVADTTAGIVVLIAILVASRELLRRGRR